MARHIDSSPPVRRWGLLARLVVALAAAAFGLAVGEAAVRAFVREPAPIRLAQFAGIVEEAHHLRFEEVFASDPDLFWRLDADVELPSDAWPLPGRVSNGQGFREERDLPRTKPDGERRILFLGDSVTFGYGLPHGAAFPAIVERELASRFAGGVECINAGVPGYSLLQGRELLRSRGAGIAPDLVVAAFGWNDAVSWDGHGDLAHLQHARARMLPAGLDRLRLARLAARALAEPLPPAPFDRRPRLLPHEFRRVLDALSAETRALGAELVVLVLPSRSNLDPRFDGWRSPLQDEQRTFAERHPAPEGRARVVDAVGPFRALAAERPVREILIDGVHPTSAGHEVLARLVADAVEPWLSAATPPRSHEPQEDAAMPGSLAALLLEPPASQRDGASASGVGPAGSGGGPVTFTRDVAPILHESCVPCHRPGGAGPFPLLEHRDAARRADQIAELTARRYMPPWLPRPSAHPFEGERRLSEAEIELLGRWAAAGAPEGDPAELPPAPRFGDGWALGEPDLVIDFDDPYELGAAGADEFRNFALELPVERTRWVRAFEFRPGTRLAVHHATITVDRSGRASFYDAEDPEPGFDGMIVGGAERPDGHMLGWVAGKRPYVVDEEIAWRLDPGSDLVVQLHLQPTGKTERIGPSVGLWFAEAPASRTPFMIRLGSRTIDIPAGAARHVVRDLYVLPVDVELLGLSPHAHYLGRSMDVWAVHPDGTREDLLSIPGWDFDWQDEYRLADPVTLPKGTTLVMAYAYDNSAGNPRNPHRPPQRVHFGPDSDDEMGDLWVQVLPRSSADLEVLRHDFGQKELEANIACYEKLVALDPRDYAAHFELGSALLAQGREERAVEHFRRALEIEPDYAFAHGRLGMLLHEAGRYEDAVDHYRRALEALPDLAEVHHNLALSLKAAGRNADAIAAYRRALELRPDLAGGWYNLGNALVAAGSLAEALEAYRQAVRTQPEHAESWHNLGAALAAAGDLGEAEACFRRAVALDPGYAQARVSLARARLVAGDAAGAASELEQALRLDPGNAAAQRLRSSLPRS